MIYKTSKELRRIFDLNRDEMRYLSDDKTGVLKPIRPEKSDKRNTTAAKYSEYDIDCLIDIKIHLLSGYKKNDMKKIFSKNYDSYNEIAEQIKTYKRRILILELIQKIRSNLREAKEFISEQYVDVVVSTAKTLNSYGYEIKSYEDFYEIFLDLIKLVFIIDYLSQKESLDNENEIKSLNRFKEAFDIIIRYLGLFETQLKPEDITKGFIEMIDTPEEGEEEAKAFAKEFVKKLSGKKRVIKRAMRKNWEEYTKEWGAQSGENYRERMMIIYDFVFEYFADEDTIYCLVKNFERFLRGLDREALERGEVKLPKDKEVDLYA